MIRVGPNPIVFQPTDSCRGSLTLRSFGIVYELASPMWPNRVRHGDTCQWVITKNNDEGHISVRFRDIGSRGIFNITTSGKPFWRFQSAPGLQSLATEERRLEIRYAAPRTGSDWVEDTEFLIEVSWRSGLVNGENSNCIKTTFNWKT